MSAASTSLPDDIAPLMETGANAAHANTSNPDPDATLMREAANGSEKAFSELVQSHQRGLLTFFTRLGAQSDCEDLVQETFVRLFRYRKQYRESARFIAFLHHIARNVWSDRGRKNARIERLAVEYGHEQQNGIARAPERRGESADVERALKQLSPKLREVIVLNIFQGMRYQEIADALKIPLGTVKSRINLALTALKDELK